MHPTGMQSDTFKFHIRKLLHLGYVQKLPSGEYALTPAGKEYANDLDDARRTIQKQPKLSLTIVVSRTNEDGTVEYLMQQRRRNPFYGYWGCISGPARWGEDFSVTAAEELHKQTGLSADCTVSSFMRQTDVEAEGILEDKLFVVLKATVTSGTLSNVWRGGHNQWMTMQEVLQQEHRFAQTTDLIQLAGEIGTYKTNTTDYSPDKY